MSQEASSHTLIGVLLAGGQSRRMGQTKAAIPLPGGVSLSERLIQQLSPLCTRILVLGHGEGVQPGPHRHFLRDKRSDIGPLGGIETALDALKLGESCLILPCDMPAIDTAFLNGLLASPLRDAPGRAYRVDGRLEPFPLLLSKRALPALQDYVDSGKRALIPLLRALDLHLVDLPHESKPAFTNLNHPEDLDHYLKMQ